MAIPKKRIVVLDYDPQWPIIFEKLKQMYMDVIGNYVLSIEHVGSTSVPGLAAKPIIDIDIVIDQESFDTVKLGLESLGYFHNGDQGIKGREAFRLPFESELRDPRHHLYVCNKDSVELHRHIAFRDYLRRHEDVKDMYGEIKKEGARICNDDIDIYMDHKGEFVTQHLVKAMVEADIVPIPTIIECDNCKSKDIIFNFRIEYNGVGLKSEHLDIKCVNCGFSWVESIE